VSINGGYIVGPGYDWFFFILSPLLAVAIGYASLKSGLGQVFMYYRDPGGSLQRLFLMATLSQIFTNAHLAIVFLRSHANAKIFRLYPLRFHPRPPADLGGGDLVAVDLRAHGLRGVLVGRLPGR
jgi:hypothetical protein